MVQSTATIDALSRCHLPEVDIAFLRSGPAGGELVILLHGFPEYSGAWRKQIDCLAAAGFCVVAPDQRGYGRSSKPRAIEDYDLDKLADDVTGLAHQFGRRGFSLVGHDWGGLVAWWIASRNPPALRRMIALNAPHPAIWREAMRRDWRQWLRSWYVRAMQMPRLPELMLRRNGFQALSQALEPAKLSPSELDQYREAWAQPGALTGMINWYRAIARRRLPAAASYAIDVPTLILWGDQDPYALPELADRGARLCRNARVVHLPESTHWVHHEQPERTCTMLVEFLSQPLSGA